MTYENSVKFKKSLERINQNWNTFQEYRTESIRMIEKGDTTLSEGVGKIIRFIFSQVLDFEPSIIAEDPNDDNFILIRDRVGSIVLIIEKKEKGNLDWDYNLMSKAFEHNTYLTGKCDGLELKIWAIKNHIPYQRVFINLDTQKPQDKLCWLSENGIFQQCEEEGIKTYKGEPLPMSSFAYIGDPLKKGTWKMPFRYEDGSINERRLKAALQSLVKSHRGEKTKIGDPLKETPIVLLRLGKAVAEIGQMPFQTGNEDDPNNIYQMLQDRLNQFKKLKELKKYTKSKQFATITKQIKEAQEKLLASQKAGQEKILVGQKEGQDKILAGQKAVEDTIIQKLDEIADEIIQNEDANKLLEKLEVRNAEKLLKKIFKNMIKYKWKEEKINTFLKKFYLAMQKKIELEQAFRPDWKQKVLNAIKSGLSLIVGVTIANLAESAITSIVQKITDLLS